MKKGNQKPKGNSYERVIAKLFAKAYYPDDDGEFRRVPLSGGWDKRVVPGDIMALKYSTAEGTELILDTSFPLSIECKNWRDVKHFFSGLYVARSQIYDWVDQARSDSAASGRIPMVVFKLIRGKNIAILNLTDFSQMSELFGRFPGNYYILKKRPDYDDDVYDLVFYLLSDFINWIDWGVYKILGKQVIRSLIAK